MSLSMRVWAVVPSYADTQYDDTMQWYVPLVTLEPF